jgi:hypothetical protein
LHLCILALLRIDITSAQPREESGRSNHLTKLSFVIANHANINLLISISHGATANKD